MTPYTKCVKTKRVTEKDLKDCTTVISKNKFRRWTINRIQGKTLNPVFLCMFANKIISNDGSVFL